MNAGARRVGVFGGAFDPPHIAHVALARAAVEQLALDELRIFPTGNAWHKAHDLATAEDRLAMTRIAFAQRPNAVIDERELHRPGPTYTIDTLRELKAEQPQAALFLLMGEDQARAFTSWREWQAILELATLGIAARPTDGTEASLPPQARVQWLRLPAMPESATEVRASVAGHRDYARMVPPAVARYIGQHRLYRNQEN